MNIESVRLFNRLGEKRYKQREYLVLCCDVIDACNTSYDV